MANQRVGSMITWRSQSGGVWLEKTGEVISVLEPNENPREIIEKWCVKANTPRPSKSAIKAQSVSIQHRYVVRVPVKGRWYWYCPLVSVIDNQLQRRLDERKKK